MTIPFTWIDNLKKLLFHKKFILAMWFIVTLVGILKMLNRGSIKNNFLIFEGVYFHTIEKLNLYCTYPLEYDDVNLYGPIFSLVIAPFAVLPHPIDYCLWALCMSVSLYVAIKLLPIDWWTKIVIFYLAINLLFTNILHMQVTPFVGALVLFAFIFIRKENICMAAFCIALGFFIKVYGIVGFAFFFFTRHRFKLIGYFLLWSIFFFVLPMIISSPTFVVDSYNDWYYSLIAKNMKNATVVHQDISAFGFVRRVLNNRNISTVVVLIPALILFALQYIKVKYYKDLRYQLLILASTLICVVIFSTGSESPSYLIAVVGVGIWFGIQSRPYSGLSIFLLVFVVVLTVLSNTDLIPWYIRSNYVWEYSLKALPCMCVWLVLVYQILRFPRNLVSGIEPERESNKWKAIL